MGQPVLPNSALLFTTALALRAPRFVEISWESYGARAGELAEAGLCGLREAVVPALVVHIAVLQIAQGATGKSFGTGLHLERIWVILTLMPAVRKGTLQTLGTSVLVHADCLGGVPHGTGFLRVVVQLRLPSEVLPIVRVNAGVSHVSRINEGTPHCLVVKVVKVEVFRELSNEVNADFSFVVREGTVLSVVAQACRAQVALAELGFVLVRVVKLFDTCVTVNAGFPLGTLLLLCDEAAKF